MLHAIRLISGIAYRNKGTSTNSTVLLSYMKYKAPWWIDWNTWIKSAKTWSNLASQLHIDPDLTEYLMYLDESYPSDLGYTDEDRKRLIMKAIMERIDDLRTS